MIFIRFIYIMCFRILIDEQLNVIYNLVYDWEEVKRQYDEINRIVKC